MLTRSDVMAARDVAELLGVTKRTVDRWGREGRLPSVQIGRRRIFVRPQVEAVLTGATLSREAAR